MTTQHTPEAPKPCPHCGGEPRWIYHSNNFDGAALMSLHCCASIIGTRAFVLEKWNTRLPVDQQRDYLRKSLRTAVSVGLSCTGQMRRTAAMIIEHDQKNDLWRLADNADSTLLNLHSATAPEPK